MPRKTTPCHRCGGRKRSGQGIRYCSEACRTGRRVCTQCGEKRSVPDEIRPRAKFCATCITANKRAYGQRHYAANAEKVKASVRAYRTENAEKVNEYKRRYYEQNREAVRARQNAYAREHRDEQNARQRAWYKANRDRAKAMSDRWRKRHPEQIRAARERYMQRVRADPDWAAQRRESQRMSARLRAERLGAPMKALSQDEYERAYGIAFQHAETVGVEPLKTWLNETVDLTSLAHNAKLDRTLLDQIRRGERKTLTVRAADQICVALDLPFSLLYQDAA